MIESRFTIASVFPREKKDILFFSKKDSRSIGNLFREKGSNNNNKDDESYIIDQGEEE